MCSARSGIWRSCPILPRWLCQLPAPPIRGKFFFSSPQELPLVCSAQVRRHETKAGRSRCSLRSV